MVHPSIPPMVKAMISSAGRCRIQTAQRQLCVWLLLLACCRSVPAAAPDVYETRWRDAGINDRIERNIEKHRMGDLVLELRDADGKPVSGARVELRQTSHEFLFGCNAFVLGQLNTDAANQRYEEMFTGLFNFATVPFYWEGTEPERGELRYQEGSRDMWRRPPADRYIPFAEKYGLTLKGHPLLWHAYNPKWLPQDADALRDLYRKRFREIAERYGDKIAIWDVVNESQVCSKTYPLYTPDRAYVGWAFQEAARVFPPSALLMINEVASFNFKPADANPYVAQIRSLLGQGLAVKGIGLQYHYFRREALDNHLTGPDCDPRKMLDLYEKLAEFKLPLYITEITIPSAGENGGDLQADVVRDHYRLWFSAPTMAGITWWNLGDGTAVKGENEAQGGLVDNELKPKPAYRALDELIHRQWTTTASAETDAAGRIQVRGFFGKYEVTASGGGKTGRWQVTHSGKSPELQTIRYQ